MLNSSCDFLYWAFALLLNIVASHSCAATAKLNFSRSGSYYVCNMSAKGLAIYIIQDRVGTVFIE